MIKRVMKKILILIILQMLLYSFNTNICTKTKAVSNVKVNTKIEVASNTNKEDNKETENSEEEIMQSQQETLNISGFIAEAKKYTEEGFEDLNMNELFSSALTGNIDNKTIMKSILKIVGKEVVNCITVLGSIIVIIVIHSIIKSVSDGLGNKGIAQITYYVQYILIVTLIMTNFADIIVMVKDTIQNLVGFMNSLIPILITLMLTTGNIASASLLEPIILFVITFIGNFIEIFLIPLVLISSVLGIISKISDRVQIDKLAQFFNSSVIWILGIVLTLFVGIISVEGNLSSTVDGITAKTAKAAVTNFIPVVGKILGDAVDTVIGCSSILKNAVGIIGIIVILCICIAPIIKLAILMGLYYLASALCQPIADTKIVKLLEQMGGTFKLLLAIMCSISVMLIVGTTLVINISNSGMMYR